jgi:hypothetical protein
MRDYVASVMAPQMPTYQGWTPCYDWCRENIGNTGWTFVGEGVFEFSNEKDYLMFMLRWA